MRCQLLVLILILISGSGRCADIKACFSDTSTDNIVLVKNINGTLLYSKNIKKSFVPASTIKILTALTAIHYLGKEFKFKTKFFLDKNKNLKIKGYGDPFLISEIWEDIARTLSEKISFVKDIVIDDSYFRRDIKIPGTGNSLNPYDAPVGALCINFNTIYVKIEDGKVSSAESQTPLIPFALKLTAHLNQGGRYVISHNTQEAERYAGELFKYFLNKHGTKVRGNIRFGYVRKEDKLIYTYYSRFSLMEIIKSMMEYSNNFIANQIMLVLGAEKQGPPATLDKGVSVIRNYATSNLGLKDIRIVEGSGISKENQISCNDMVNILKRFRPYMGLLKKRGNIYYKTGTLKGIKTRVGYITSKKGIFIFVLSFKQPFPDISRIVDCIANNVIY